MNEVEVFADLEALAAAAARRVADWLCEAVEGQGEATLVLAGGSTPRRLYELLSVAPDGPDWRAVSIYFGDERAVAADHPDSNFRMAEQSLLARLPAAPRAVHRIEGELGNAQAATRYAATLPARFDVVLLGLGEDGHTASLFPGRPELESTARVVAAHGPKPPPERVSLGLAALNAAQRIAFLVSGAGKAPALARVMAERQSGQPRLPAARVQPVAGELLFLVDAQAAGALGRVQNGD